MDLSHDSLQTNKQTNRHPHKLHLAKKIVNSILKIKYFDRVF